MCDASAGAEGATLSATTDRVERTARRPSRRKDSWASRGRAVRHIVPSLPPTITDRIERDVCRRGRSLGRGPGGLVADLERLLAGPLVADWMATQPAPLRKDFAAAVTSRFIGRVWTAAPGLAAEYVDGLLPAVIGAARSVAGMCRLNWDPEFRRSVASDAPLDVQRSLFGPLAIFFLQSISRTALAWDVLLDPEECPARSRPFGWVPSAEGFHSTLRGLLTFQGRRTLKQGAVLYSPLGAYLVHLGMAKRVSAVRWLCPACGRSGGSLTCPACGNVRERRIRTWLLSSRYLSRCPIILPEGCERTVVAGEVGTLEARPPLKTVRRDRRTRCEVEPPEAVLRRRRIVAACHAAARRLVRDLAEGTVTPLKLLSVCVELAQPEGPLESIGQILASENGCWATLAEAMVAPRMADRERHVARINRRLPALAEELGVGGSPPMTESQFGVYLTRLRGRYLKLARRLAAEVLGEGGP